MYDEASNMVRVDMDMIFSIQDWNKLIGLNESYNRPYKRQAIRPGAGGNRWPGGVIPYEIDSYDFRNRRHEQTLYDAMDDWMHYTCVQFVPAQPFIRNKIRFVDGDGCSSNVGMVGKTQKVTLANGCRVKGVVIHELGHVLGFHHEQTRPDRDQYVRIHTENIPDHLEFNFKKYNWAVIADLGVSYDYLSIMHYGSKSFSSNGRHTIETLNPFYQDLIGNRDGLSFRDIKSVNLLYDCRPANCPLYDADCPGEGFVSKNCECWCPSSKPYGDNPYVVCHPGGSPGGGYWNGGGGNWDGGMNGGGMNGGNMGGGCQDRHPNCARWQSWGECSKNSFYMHEYCRLSCGLCGTVEPRCEDKYQKMTCVYWRNRGFCHVSNDYSSFMTLNYGYPSGMILDPEVGSDSGGSGTDSGGSGTDSGGSGTDSGETGSRSCQDTEPTDACRVWKDEGECQKSAVRMKLRCARTCDMCGSRNP
ncbi:hypothetical protein BaRGS_00001354 [Batillaria attramentaria]|uniref:Metalloendopeptidase n=1 Tax=Batillaria attramentaria TaxID=370345 RepID=A0ABD0M6L0_9CAEN